MKPQRHFSHFIFFLEFVFLYHRGNDYNTDFTTYLWNQNKNRTIAAPVCLTGHHVDIFWHELSEG